ncbi:NUDIX domain-containing protein [Candidatus Bipolaricaulota bacterium]|nr:NUDIX domain-containing protein [Candidatus Bipolaricaulota bacterium]
MSQVVLAVVENSYSELLLIHRTNEPKVWSPPGGYVKGGEPEEAARREAREETGIKDLSLLGERENYKGMKVFAYFAPTQELKWEHPEWDSIGWFKVLPNNISPPKTYLR